MTLRGRLQAVMKEETSLNEIVKLIGSDILPEDQKLTIEIARVIRLGFLQQNSFVDIDSYSEYDRQARMLALIREYDGHCREAAERGGDLTQMFSIPAREKIGRAKSVPAGQYLDNYANLMVEMDEEINAIAEKGEEEL